MSQSLKDGKQCKAGERRFCTGVKNPKNEQKAPSSQQAPAGDQNFAASPAVEFTGPTAPSSKSSEMAKDAQQRHASWVRSRVENEESEEAPSPTTRQEDTEIGIFRPDEL